MCVFVSKMHSACRQGVCMYMCVLQTEGRARVAGCRMWGSVFGVGYQHILTLALRWWWQFILHMQPRCDGGRPCGDRHGLLH